MPVVSWLLTNTSMDAYTKKLWVDALRSGVYNKVEGDLKTTERDGKTCHCALGVLMEITAPDEFFISYDEPYRRLFNVDVCAGKARQAFNDLDVAERVAITALNDNNIYVETDGLVYKSRIYLKTIAFQSALKGTATFNDIADFIEEYL